MQRCCPFDMTVGHPGRSIILSLVEGRRQGKVGPFWRLGYRGTTVCKPESGWHRCLDACIRIERFQQVESLTKFWGFFISIRRISIASSMDCILDTILSNTTILYASFSEELKPAACIRRICLRTVDLPDSPAPNFFFLKSYYFRFSAKEYK